MVSKSGARGRFRDCALTASQWISRVVISICATIPTAISGQDHGSPSVSRWTHINPFVGTAQPTTIESRYSGIHTEATYFVPLGQTFEYWRLKVTNESEQPRDLSAFSYCEFTNQWRIHNRIRSICNTRFLLSKATSRTTGCCASQSTTT